MIGYTCKYTPIELLESLGAVPALLEKEENDFEQAESLTHANLCSHAKALIEQGMNQEELILMDCCDSLRRAFDVMRRHHQYKFFDLLDLPHENGGCAVDRFKKELLKLKRLYGGEFDREKFFLAIDKYKNDIPNENYIAVLGARISPELLNTIEDQMHYAVINLTCSGNRNLEDPPDELKEASFDEIIDWYAGALLHMIPCMRMTDVNERKRLINDPNLKGIIYNTVKFCDFYSFDFARLKRETDLPILKIESDFSPGASGQILTRLEAFNETLNPDQKKIMTKNKKYYAGIDSGSTSTNMVVLDGDKNILASSIVRTGAKAQNGAEAALTEVCISLGVEPDELNIIATGYGRYNIPFAEDTKTEISCHAKGAHFLNPDIKTIIDIGGQDSKVICLDETGNVKNFIMNDKCAAGTGRFLEAMAKTLELELSQMAVKGQKYHKDLTISSMCTVFAESEVISLIADNNLEDDIIHGLNKSIASRTISMVRRSKGTGDYMMTGGVARNKGVVRELEERLGEPLFVTENPDLCGALGAALFALEG